jgi:hypothetical protein
VVAVLLGTLVGLLAFWQTSRSFDEPGGDFWQHWAAAKAVLAGIDPYIAITPSTLRVAGNPATTIGHWYFYPLPAALLGMPFVWLSPAAAAAAFVGLSTAALSFVITRAGFGALVMCLSSPFVLSVLGAQSPPAIIAAALVPAAQGLLTLKPNLGIALFAAKPSYWSWIGGAALIGVAFVWLPSWPHEWLSTVARSPFHRAPILWWHGAPILLLAALKWRRSEARLFVVLASVPQVPLFYDQLPLALVPRSERERLTFAWCSWVGYLGWVITSSRGHMRAADMHDAPIWILAFVYGPSLIMILRRPNTGGVPERLERCVTRARHWTRRAPR